MTRTLVLGIGNVLLTDDGAGVHAVRQLAGELGEAPGVQYLDGGTLSFSLAPAIEEADRLIVFDAAQLGAPAGTVRCLVDGEMDRFLGRCKRSVHEVALLDLLDIARLTDSLPRQRALIGIQPDAIEWGEAPTARVAEGIRRAVETGAGLIAAWPEAPSDAATLPEVACA
ncbi:MAG TPA: HyaD/HybD family hydrogenase maturation endopeptidase [Steroidobacteraceae bacterium]|nr:HyaD/HybD family hydrogenase maturation endopeptidase [Steroidobacteraceae bacterium]